MAETAKTRPGTIHLIDALQYRMPLASVVSILHRASGAILFAAASVRRLDVRHQRHLRRSPSTISLAPSSPGSASCRHGSSSSPLLALIWAYLHHFVAGLRHLWMDATHSVSKEFGRQSAVFTLGLSGLLTVLLGAKLFGLY